MNETWMTVVGRVAGDVRVAETGTGTPVATFRLATSSRWFDRAAGEWRDGDTAFISVSCWRGLAGNVASSLAKGDPVVVHGKFRTRRWEKDGRGGTEPEIDAVAVGHDLSRGTAMFRPVRRAASDARPEAATEPAAEPVAEAASPAA